MRDITEMYSYSIKGIDTLSHRIIGILNQGTPAVSYVDHYLGYYRTNTDICSYLVCIFLYINSRHH